MYFGIYPFVNKMTNLIYWLFDIDFITEHKYFNENNNNNNNCKSSYIQTFLFGPNILSSFFLLQSRGIQSPGHIFNYVPQIQD